MTNSAMSDFSNLIERLEKATGPDRELDVKIAKHLGGSISYFVTQYEGRVHVNWPDTDFNVLQEVPRYTALIDTALTLVPEGWVWGIAENDKADILSGGGFQAFVRAQLDGSGDFCAANYQHTEHECASIALCIAALKAREAKR